MGPGKTTAAPISFAFRERAPPSAHTSPPPVPRQKVQFSSSVELATTKSPTPFPPPPKNVKFKEKEMAPSPRPSPEALAEAVQQMLPSLEARLRRQLLPFLRKKIGEDIKKDILGLIKGERKEEAL